jgi:hypothetical protein
VILCAFTLHGEDSIPSLKQQLLWHVERDYSGLIRH